MAIKDTPEEWTVTATTTPFTGNKTSVRTDQVVMPDGSTVSRDYQVHPGSVAVLALDDAAGAGAAPVPPPRTPEAVGDPRRAARRPRREPAARGAARAVRGGARQGRGLAGADRRLHHAGGCDEAVRIFLARELSEAEGERFEVSEEEADMELARVPQEELVRGALAGELHNNCLVVGVLALTAAQGGPGLDALRPADAPWPARPFEA